MNGEAVTGGGAGFPATLLATVVALVLVLVLAWFAIRLLARLGVGRGVAGGGASRLRVLQSVPVGARERLVLVRCDGVDYLIGVAAGGVSLLSTTEPPATSPVGAATSANLAGDDGTT